eukprot:Seg10095.1 transcript_id=Seg10095.1/GoldUCD/mRNA.D3Y31 product="Zinc finger MYM-type protein 1" protein_id=Seg10095.1/GoldUCD/D3Y31
MPSGEAVKRQWLSYSESKEALFCTVCLAFEPLGSVSTASNFVTGFKDFRRVSQRVTEHEASKTHSKHVQDYLRSINDDDIVSAFNMSEMNHRKAVKERREVLDRIIEVIKTMGRQVLSFRGHREEAGYALDGETENHGNFLAIVQLLSKYDEKLSRHLETVIKQSKLRKERLKKKGMEKSKGRGSLVTMISKTTINQILEIIKTMMQEKISDEVAHAKIFSIQVDTTQDITTTDQCSFVVQYVLDDCIHERFVAIVPSHDGSGQGLFDLLKESLERLGIDIKNCISDSTDGAASCHGLYNGLQAKLTEAADQHVHIWCYAHVLNLVIVDATKCCIMSVSFFSLLQKTATFIKASYKRADVWKKQLEGRIGTEKTRRLKLIGETRWSGKSNALRGIFGTYEQPRVSSFMDLLICLFTISTSQTFELAVREEAQALISAFV